MQQRSVGMGSDACPRGAGPVRQFRAGGFSIHAADSQQHRHSARQLVGRRYAQRGYLRAGAAEAEVPHEPQLVVLSATGPCGGTLGTLGVRFDSAQGLNAETCFAAEIAALRGAGARLCEFTQLALDAAAASKRVLAALFHTAYLHAYKLRGMDTLVIEVNPRHVGYYRRMLGFQVCSEVRMNPRVQAPAVLMRVALSGVERQIAQHGGRPERAAEERTLYPYAFGAEQEAELLAALGLRSEPLAAAA